MQYYVDLWTNYFNFTGRTSRKGYWMAILFNFLATALIGLISRWIGIEWLANVYSYAIMIPGLAICVRRLRDAGKHWAWIFINLVPVVGQIIFIFMLCKPSAAPAQAEHSQAYDF